MRQHRRARNTKILWGMILLGIAYGSLVYYRHPLTGTYRLDGIIGVLLGLYICSHPAANMLDMLFFDPDSLRYVSSWRDVLLWLMLNLLVLLVGWTIIFIGTTQFTHRAI